MPLDIKPKETKIDFTNLWGDDLFQRKECADKLTQILSFSSSPLTIALNGEWGSGKSYLLRRWQEQLKQDGFKAIYFNAWEDDWLEDPLLALLGQLWMTLDCERNVSLSGDDKFSKNIPLLMDMLSIAADSFLSNCSKIDIAKLKESYKTPEGKILDKYLQYSQSIMVLRSKLSVLSETFFTQTQKPLVFIVDELDRCRPTYAIETLERIKHLFNIDHIVFVLGIDRKQLGSSIQSVYGCIDIENYLHRFIDLEFIIPAVDPSTFFDWHMNNDVQAFVTNLMSRCNSSISQEVWREFCANLKDLILNHNFSLRQIEHFFIVLRCFLNCNGLSQKNIILLSVLVILKIGNPLMYRQYINREISPKEVIDFLIPENARMDDTYAVIMACLIYCTYLPPKESNDTVFHTQIVDLLETIRTVDNITKHALCARCIIKAFSNEKITYNFICHSPSWIRTYHSREINSDILDNLVKQVELDFFYIAKG